MAVISPGAHQTYIVAVIAAHGIVIARGFTLFGGKGLNGLEIRQRIHCPGAQLGISLV